MRSPSVQQTDGFDFRYFEKSYRNSRLVAGAALVNRLVSMVHVMTLTRRHNRELDEQKAGLDFRIGPRDTVDGLVFGPDPRQGYVEGGVFYHPTLRFVFRFPAGWKVQNLPSQVTMIAPEEDAAVILQAEQSTQDPRAYAAAKAQQLENATLQGERATRVNGMSAYQQVWDVTQEQGESSEQWEQEASPGQPAAGLDETSHGRSS